MQKYTLVIGLIFLSLTFNLDGIYHSGTNRLTIKKDASDTLKIELSISHQGCAMLPFEGFVTMVEENKYEGKIHPSDLPEIETSLKMTAIDEKLNLTTTEGGIDLGANCWMDGSYYRKEK